VRGLLGAHHVVGIRLVGHAERDTQVGVRAEVVLDDTGRSLGRHDQVDAQRSSALGDVDDAVHEFGHLAHERRELVDHEHERGRTVGISAFLQFEQILGLLAVQQVLAVAQLGAQARERATHEVRAQVGDEPDAVRQVDAVRERGTALVVDEQEGHAVGTVLGSHPEHPGLEELRFAGTGRAAHECVRPLGAQVEVHRVDSS
jgi:hypothetical protein